jgi:Stage II sporulation protein E (SpoIIE)
MPGGRWTRVGIAVVVGLSGAGAGVLAGGSAGAQASDTSPTSAKSLLGISLPGVGVKLPGIGVTVPSVGVSVPGGVTLPGVTVSTPAVTLSTPEVTVSTPALTGTTPSQPSKTTTETPTSTGSTPTAPPGGGAGGSPTVPSSTAPEHTGEKASAASVSDTTPSASQVAASSRRTSTGAGGRRRHASAARHVPGHRGGGAGAATAASGGGALDSGDRSPSGAPRVPRAAARHASNLLDTIGKHIPLPLPVPDWSKPIILLLLVLAIWFCVRARIASRRAGRLERQRTTLLQDVDAMQAALVAEVPERLGGLAVSVAYRPAEGPAAGGDFYDVFVPERGKVAIVLGDVAGHGHRALARAALTRYTLRAYLQAGLEPRAALALAGYVLADPSAEHFATVVLGVYRARDGLLTYASAGHPPPILHGLQTREPPAGCASPPVGWTAPTGRRQTTVSLALGAVACFFSDGLIEARRKEDMLGRERLSELVAALGPRPDAAKLLAMVKAETLATPDDMAACVLAPEMTVIAASTHIEELETDARALRGTQVRDFLGRCLVPATEIERTIERASDIAAVCGTALLRVDLAAPSATVITTAPTSSPRGVIADGRPQPAGEPSRTY